MSTNEGKKETEANSPPSYYTHTHTHEATIPAHLIASVSALGAAVAAGGLDALPRHKSSPEELARLVDHLQETFGAGSGGGGGGGKGGGVTPPPPSPFTAGCAFGGPAAAAGGAGGVGGRQQKGEETGAETARKRARYHARVEEVEDEHWTART